MTKDNNKDKGYPMFVDTGDSAMNGCGIIFICLIGLALLTVVIEVILAILTI